MIDITNEIELRELDETCINGFQPGYVEVLIKHFSTKFDWTAEFTRQILRDAIRFLAISAVPVADSSTGEAQVMVSSPVVDKVVDSLFLDSPLLVWLERNVFGARMIHVPAYAHGVKDPAIMTARYEFTMAMMQAAGFELDRVAIWPDRLPKDYVTCTCSNDLEDCQMKSQRLE